jgi:carboxylate-amine ligase
MAFEGGRREEGDYSFGIEEEYFLANAETLEVPAETPGALFKDLDARTGGRASHESLQAQMEVSTEPMTAVVEVRDRLRSLRASSQEAAAKYGFAILACGTHPTAEWHRVAPTASERYFKVMDELQMIGRRNMLCGMHVHVELPDPRRRASVMSQMLPYLPLFVALSTSSPFWHSRDTGLRSYRLSAYDELPRSGIPELFASEEDYELYVASLVRAGTIKDASYIWWAVRPSLRYPTLELRAPDCCTRLDDAIAIACLYRTLVRHLFKNADSNPGGSALRRSLAVVNKWTAQRFGIHGVFATEGEPISVPQFLDVVIAMVAEDAADLGCSREVDHCRTIISGGTSADAQLKVYEERKHEGHDSAVKAVAWWVAETTAAY